MSNIIGAIKIILDQLYNEDATIGLYNDVTDTFSELRWSERELLGVTDDYNYTYIMKNGIGPVSQSIECRLGGNNVTVSNFSVSVKGLSQLIIKLNELKIQLSGKTIIYYEFVGSDTDSDSVEIYQQFTGTIEDREYNQFETLITAKSSFALKRNKCLGKTVTTTEYEDADSDIVNQNIPVTFGRSDPDNGIYFKLPRLQYRNNVLTRGDFLLNPTHPLLSLFAVVNDDLSDSQSYTWDNIKANYQANKIELAFGDYGATILSLFINPEGLYIKVSHDSDSPEGEIRRIESFDGIQIGFTMYGYSEIQLKAAYTLEEYYSSVPKPFHDVAGDGLDELVFALASVIDALLEYCLDHSYCECFITNEKKVFIKESDTMIRLQDVGVERVTYAIPIYDINASVFEDEIGSVSSKVIVPIDNIEQYDSVTDDLVTYGIDGGYVEQKDGLFSYNLPNFVFYNPVETGTVANTKDKDRSTYYQSAVNIELWNPDDTFDYYRALKITVPQIGDEIQFDKVYLGIDLETYILDEYSNPPHKDFNGSFKIVHRSFYNIIENPVDKSSIDYKNTFTLRSLPDKYYSPNESTSNYYYYFNTDNSNSMSGYKLFELTGITTPQEFNNIYELLLLFYKTNGYYNEVITLTDFIKIYEAAFIFEKSTTIGNEVYA